MKYIFEPFEPGRGNIRRMGQKMKQIHTFRPGLFTAMLFFLASAAMAQGLTMRSGGPFIVVEIHGAPDYRFSSDRGWTRIRFASTLPDSARVDIAMTESVVLKSVRGETYVLQGVYDFPLSRLGMRGAILRRMPRASGFSAPVATSGVRGAEGGGDAPGKITYRTPGELHAAFKTAVLSGNGAEFPAFFVEDVFEDSRVDFLIRSLALLLPSPDTQAIEWAKIPSRSLLGGPGQTRREIAAWFEHWAEAINIGSVDESDFRYRLLPESRNNQYHWYLRHAAVETLREHILVKHLAIEYWWARYEMESRRICPELPARELVESGMPEDLLKSPLGHPLTIQADSRWPWVFTVEDSSALGDAQWWIHVPNMLRKRVELELRGLERLIRDYREVNGGRLPQTLEEASRTLFRATSTPNPLEDVGVLFKYYSSVIEEPDVLILEDPWGNPYEYLVSGDSYVLKSAAPTSETFVVEGPRLPLRIAIDRDSGIAIGRESSGTIVFSVRVEDKDSRVYIAGQFNDWKKWPMQFDAQTEQWTIRVPLRPGRYTYKFIQDDEWFPDPGNPERLPDGYGGFNSVITVKE